MCKTLRLLLPGGVDIEAFQALENGRALHWPGERPAAGGRGYALANPPAWIEALHPQVILLSVGVEGRRVLPSPETMDVVDGYPLLRTDRNGS